MNSLFDGRLAEQGHRMQQWQREQSEHNTQISVWVIVIVEQGPQKMEGVRHRHCLKTILRLTLEASKHPRHLVLRTNGMQETALLLLTLTRTIREHSVRDGRMTTGCAETQWVVSAPPRRTCGDVYLRQLCCVPGVSPNRAQCIRHLYPDMQSLCAALATCPEQVASNIGKAVRNIPLGRRFVTLLLNSKDEISNQPHSMHGKKPSTNGRPTGSKRLNRREVHASKKNATVGCNRKPQPPKSRPSRTSIAATACSSEAGGGCGLRRIIPDASNGGSDPANLSAHERSQPPRIPLSTLWRSTAEHAPV